VETQRRTLWELASPTPTVPVACDAGVPLCGLICCPSGICNNLMCKASPTFNISIGANPLEVFGVDICVSGAGFTPGASREDNDHGNTRIDVRAGRSHRRCNGALFATFGEVGNTIACSSIQADSIVTVTATDSNPTSIGTGQSTSYQIPGCMWCGNPLSCHGVGTCE
jgi:hypothetical protein